MNPMALPPQPGRLGRGPFVLATSLVYVLSFLSQVLLSPPVNARVGVWAFVPTQAILIGLWYLLHRRRLRDAGRPPGIAAGIAAVYALEVVFVTMVIWLILSSALPRGEGADPEAGLLNLFVFLNLIALLTGDAMLGGIASWLAGILVLMMLPIVIALAFSLWAATRPSVPPTQP